MWDFEGTLIWEDSVNPQQREGSSVDAVVLEDLDEDGIEEIAVLSHNLLQVRSGKDGKLVWAKQRFAFLSSFFAFSSS
jgi:hypothetical protein